MLGSFKFSPPSDFLYFGSPKTVFALDSHSLLPAKICSALLNWMTVKFLILLAPISYLWMLTPMFLHIYNGGAGNYYGIWFQCQPIFWKQDIQKWIKENRILNIYTINLLNKTKLRIHRMRFWSLDFQSKTMILLILWSAYFKYMDILKMLIDIHKKFTR